MAGDLAGRSDGNIRENDAVTQRRSTGGITSGATQNTQW
jgi:hypothetical protein